MFDDYVGLPFQERGRGPAYDCWGLFRLVMREKFGVELASFSEAYVTDFDKAELAGLIAGNLPADWIEIERGSEVVGDGVLMSLAGQPRHIGLVVGRNLVLHTERKTGSLIENYTRSKIAPRILGFYRHSSKYMNDQPQNPQQ